MQNDEQIGELIASFIELIGFTRAELAKLSELQSEQRADIEELQKAQNQLAQRTKQQIGFTQAEFNNRLGELKAYFEQSQARDKEFQDKLMAIASVVTLVVIPIVVGVVTLIFEKVMK